MFIHLRCHFGAELVLVVAVVLQLAVAARQPVARLAEQRQPLLRGKQLFNSNHSTRSLELHFRAPESMLKVDVTFFFNG